MATSIDFSDAQKTQLRKCEASIKKGNKGFFEMCSAFREIEDNELWKGSHDTFPSYCKDRWHLDASTVSHYIKAAEVLDDLSEFDRVPENEGQCRVLGRLTTEQRQDVWAKVLDSDEKPTGSLIQMVAIKSGFLTKPEKKEKAPLKEQTFLSTFAGTVNALNFVADSVKDFDAEDAVQVREYVIRCRSLLDQIDKAIGDSQVTVVA